MAINGRKTTTWANRLWLLLLVLVVLGVAAGLMAWLIHVDAVIWLAQANAWLADVVIKRLGYLGVFLLMTIESSFIPFPSEIVIPPAGDLARRLPDWTLVGVIFWGTAGSLAGALVNYWLAWYLGRPLLLALIHRYGRLVRVGEAEFHRAEAFFLRHGAVSTLVGRMMPVIRQLISLPAGLAGMSMGGFIALTTLGAGVWVTTLAVAGYWFGADPERLAQFIRGESHWLILVAVLGLGGYFLYWQWRVRSKPNSVSG